MPGNLIFYEGSVLSQTHLEVVAYPQLEVKLAEMDRLVKANPDDPTALTDRGDYLLDKGDLTSAIADFRKALEATSPPVETLAQGAGQAPRVVHRAVPARLRQGRGVHQGVRGTLQHRPDRHSTAPTAPPRWPRCAAAGPTSCASSARAARARTGSSRRSRSTSSSAWRPKDDLIQVVDEPTVKTAPDVWSQGRIASMVVNAKDPKQRSALEEQIKKRWDKIKGTKTPPLDELRKFVALFGSLFDVGKEARLRPGRAPDGRHRRQLAARGRAATQPAPQRVGEAGDHRPRPRGAGPAQPGQEAPRGRRLLLPPARRAASPTIKVNGKTGAEYLDDLATDKRYLPYIDQTGRFTIKGKVKLRADDGGRQGLLRADVAGLPIQPRRRGAAVLQPTTRSA